MDTTNISNNEMGSNPDNNSRYISVVSRQSNPARASQNTNNSVSHVTSRHSSSANSRHSVGTSATKNVHYLSDGDNNHNDDAFISESPHSNRSLLSPHPVASGHQSPASQHNLVHSSVSQVPEHIITQHQRHYNKILSTRLKPAVDEMYSRSQRMSLVESITRGLFQHSLYILTIKPSEVNTRDQKHRTPVMLCAFIADARWRQSLLRTLLQENVDLDARDSDGKTALHHSCEMARADMVDLLLKAGCSHLLNRRDVTGRTPIDYAKLDRLCANLISEQSEIMFNEKIMNNNVKRRLKIRPQSAAACLFYYRQQPKPVQWNAFEKRGRCPTLIDALQFAPSLRENLDVAEVDDSDLPTSTCYYDKDQQLLRRSCRPQPPIINDLKKSYLTSSPVATLLVMHGEQMSTNYRPTAKGSAESNDALFKLLRATLETQQQQEETNIAKQKTKMFSAKMVARQLLQRHRTGSVTSSSGTRRMRGGDSVSEDEEVQVSPTSGSTASSTAVLNSNGELAAPSKSFVTDPPKVSLSSNQNSPRASTQSRSGDFKS